MTEFLSWFSASNGLFARQVLQRGIAAVFAIAFLNVAAQFTPLLGSNGLLPVPRLLAVTSIRQTPSLFHFHYSDRFALGVAWTGFGVAVLLVAGLPQLGPFWLPLIAFGVLWVLYLSVVNVGQIFYGFGWESLLLEAGFLAAFLGSDQAAPPAAVLWLTRWLVFRVEFGAGMIKMRGDKVWRDLTALYYHHETQPMPNPLSRYFHHLPKLQHRIEVAGNHVAQLILPFLLFAPQPVASIAAGLIILTQLWLVASGNFSWLNVLTMLLAFAALGDSEVRWLIGVAPSGPSSAISIPFAAIIVALTVFVIILSVRPALNLVSRHQLMNASFNRYHLVGAYGAFGSINKTRHEVIIECTSDDDPATADWYEYEFKGKPGDIYRRPPQFAPYHLRLDWQMWFLGLGASGRWFPALLAKLFAADDGVLRLMRHDPLGGTPPRWIRVLTYTYRFTNRAELRDTGAYWERTFDSEIVPPVSADDLRR